MTNSIEGIAVIGMAVNVPGANNLEEFWENLKAGVESISFLSDEELAASGVEIKSIKDNPRYVRAAGILQNVEWFDAAFFGVNPREAELMDPQHRILLECSWQALEDAGYDSESYRGSIGVYVGMNKTSYLLSNLVPHGNTISPLAPNQTELANERDFLSTRISYKLNLKGPSINIQTACSTSLVAVAMAYQSLLTYQCDLALAGGVCVRIPHKQGYWYEETGVASPDGHCRPFDEQAQGTVGGSGAGIVVLKRLADAITEGDSIYAVIKGAAINNDGAAKLSYTAPSVDGQAEVVAMAQALAEVAPETISYVECHGTGTPLGDPIEIAGLTQAFRAGTNAKGFCAIGSVKSNIGHLDTAAGVAGLIKTSLALHHKLLPPSLHYERPNPKCHFEASPFYVNAKLREWKTDDTPRRAGVSSFGFGGTNAHVVLEEPPLVEPSGESRSWQLLQLSAKTNTALEAATSNLVKYLKDNPKCNFPDAAYTLSLGRRSFDHRRIVVCQHPDQAVIALETLDRTQVTTRNQERRNAPVVFMFPGQGSQYLNMGRELYDSEPVFRSELDRCAELLEPNLCCNLLRVIYPGEGQAAEATEQLTQTAIAQPAIFAIEYSLAKLWMEWGIRPERMIGHSVGEFVAACLAGVFSLKDALTLVAARGRFIQSLPAGAMLAVPLSEKDVSQFLGKDLALAAVNGSSSCVVSGPREAVDALARQLAQQENAGRHLHTSHAFHSAMMDPILGTFAEEVRKIRLHPPSIPFISSVTGTWITPEQATQPSYWVQHLRQTVRFSEGLSVLLEDLPGVLLEVGPGQTLNTFAKRHPALGAEHTVLPTLRHAQEETSDVASVLHSLGRLWLAGVEVDWSKFYAGEKRHRIPLPTYPFERKRFWIDPPLNVKPHTVVSKPLEESLNREGSVTDAQDPLPPGTREATPNPQPNVVPHSAKSRKERILETLIHITHELSGIEVAALDVKATFLELGFDSLFLTQANTEFRRKFNVKITFRQLLNEAPTLEALAQFIDSNLHPEAFREETPRPALVPAPPPAGLSQQQIGVNSSAASGQKLVQQLTEAAAQARESVTNLERILHQKFQAISELASSPKEGASSDQVGTDQSVSQLSRPAYAEAGQPSLPEPGALKPQRFGPWKPIDHSPVEGLDSQRQRHLDELISRYTARTRKSKQLTQTHRPYFADPRAVAGFRATWKEMVYPLVVERSSGSRLWDIDGNEYVDITLGFGSNLFGHSPEFVTRALEEQIRKGIEIGPQSPLAGEVARSVCELTGMERVSFCNTGSEAVLVALRVARTVTARNKIALFAGAYHGIFDEVLVKSAPTGSRPRSIPIAPGIPAHMVQDVLVLEYGDPKSLEILEEHAAELAAVLVEPIQSRRPDLQPREFLQMLREWTERSGVVLIFDEVITGFRLHSGGAQAWFNVRADLATYGKVIGGGMPIGILGGKAALMDALDGGMWNYGDASFPEVGVTYFAGTFVRHPLALAAASSVLNHLKGSGSELQQRLNDRAIRFAMDLNGHFERIGIPIHIQHCGSMFYLEFLEEHKFLGLLFFYLREKGVHIWEGRPFFISMAHTEQDLAFVARAIKESVMEMQDAGFLSASTSDPSRGAKPAHREHRVSSDPGSPAGTLAVHTLAETHRKAAPLTSSATQEFPLTESQLEIWLTTCLGEEASRAFNESSTVRLRGKLDLNAMRKAAQQMVDRHDALRTTVSADGTYQRIVPALTVDLPISDLSILDSESRKASVASALSEELQRSFDLVKGPLLRLRIFTLDEEDHLLLFVVHHIICDGWSFGVLLHELSVLYTAACQATDANLAEPMQFSEYAAWRQEQESPNRAAAETYWIGQMSAATPVLDLPGDRPRPPLKTFRAARELEWMTPDLCRTARQASALQGATLLTFLLASFKVLVHRLTGQEDIVIGIPVAGQIAPSLQDVSGSRNLVGHCVNFLPLRSQCRGDEMFSEYLRTLKARMLDAYDHQDFTFGSLVEKLGIPRDPSRLPLVSMTFNMDQALSNFEFSGLSMDLETPARDFVVFDLEVNLVDQSNDILIECTYNRDLFEAATIRRWLRHWKALLSAVIREPRQAIGRVEILDREQSHRVLEQWNDTWVAQPSDKTIHALFEAQVERSPEVVAVLSENGGLTYGELNRRANQLAHYLRKRGVGPEVLVGVCMNRSEAMVVGLLGILKAGGAYVPLEWTYPGERLKYMIQDAGITVLLTEQDLLKGLLDLGMGKDLETICLDRDWHRINQEEESNPQAAGTSEALAYVMYTSGSTGQPKGVAIPQRAVSRLVLEADYVRFGKDEVFLQMAPTSFDASTFELWGALLHGSRCVLYPGGLPNLKTLGQQIERHGITTLWLTASLFNTVIDNAPEILRPIRQLLIGGEALSVTHVRQANKQLPNTRIINGYGPTENTTFTCCHTIPKVLNESASIPIGRSITNTQVYLLDRYLNPVPVGVVGELYTGGEGLARGYWGRVDLTAERFIPNPFGKTGGGRLYRTGDLARYLPDGNIEFIGRLDNQIKLRGFRIELGEIEAALSRHSSVEQAVVICREDQGEKRLVAYFTGNTAKTSVTELRSFLKNHVPDYMIPGSLVHLERLPLTANGKVNRLALPEPVGAEGPGASGYRPPRDRLELQLAEIWESLLHVEHAGVTDNFFDLGGHSLLAVKLLGQINQSFGRNLPLVSVFQAPTIEQMASLLRQQGWKPLGESLVVVQPNGSRPPFFCVHGIVGCPRLAAYLGQDQPIYGLVQGLDGNRFFTRVEDLAAHYLKDIKMICPQGPYLLGGYSFGGLVAFEMAQQLRRAGDEVGLLALIDPTTPRQTDQPFSAEGNSHPRKQSSSERFGSRILRHLRQLQQLPGETRVPYLRERFGMMMTLLSNKGKRLTCEIYLRLGWSMPPTFRTFYIGEVLFGGHYLVASKAYRPEPYDGRAVLIYTAAEYTLDLKATWTEVIPSGLTTYAMSGNHFEILREPLIGTLAAHLGHCLEQAHEVSWWRNISGRSA